jgi:hypothetical protein
MLKDVRYPSTNGVNKRDCLFAGARKHDNQRKDGCNEENAEFPVLAAAQEPIELPVILGPRHDEEQKSCEKEKTATTDGVGPGESIEAFPFLGESALQQASQSGFIILVSEKRRK